MTEDELFQYIKKLIDNGITGTTELGQEIGKDPRQTRRYLVKMAELGMITLDSSSGRVAKTTMQDDADRLAKLDMDQFLQNEVIKAWYEDCKGRVKPDTLGSYVSSLKSIFKDMPINPKAIVVSRKNALEYWKNYQSFHKQKTGLPKVKQPQRVAFRNLLDFYGISFGHKMGKKYGLGSEHDAFKKYAGVSLFKFVPKLIDMMKEAKDYETLLWFLTGLRTSARGGALATMVWERIYFENVDDEGQPFFKIEIHETKVPKGHFHLGQEGNWFDYYPNEELKQMLREWKTTHPSFLRFVWFEDTGSDVANVHSAYRFHVRMARKLATYYCQIESEFDPLLKEYVKKRPDHVMCHTFAQMCKNQGMSDEEIASAGHWTDSQSVSWYCSTEESKVKSIKRRASEMHF